MDLIKGKKYSKSDFGITGIEKRWSEITVEGKIFTFFSFDSRFKNIIENDGLIYEGRGNYALIPFGIKEELHRHVFYKKEEGTDYEYLGRGKYESRYDEKHNKIFWE